jgi:hypothetical protein
VSTFSFPSSLREQLALNFVLAPYEGLERHHQHGGAYEKPSGLIDGLVSWERVLGRNCSNLDGGFESLDLKNGRVSKWKKKLEEISILITLTLADS